MILSFLLDLPDIAQEVRDLYQGTLANHDLHYKDAGILRFLGLSSKVQGIESKLDHVS